MADEDSDNASQDLIRNLLEKIQTIRDKISKRKEHLEEVTEKYHNEARHLQGILSKLRDLEDSFNAGEKIKDEFVEFCNLIDSRCHDVTGRLQNLDDILDTIREEEEKGPRLADRVRGMDIKVLSTSEGHKEFLDLKLEVDEWYDTLRQRFKDGKKRKLSLISKVNVEDVSQLLNAWKKASEVAREYSRMFALMKKDMESNEQSLRAKMEKIQAKAETINERNKTLDSEISLLQDKIVDAEATILQNQTVQEEIAEDLRGKVRDLSEQLRDEKRINFEKEMNVDELKGNVKDLTTREEMNKQKIALLEEHNKMLQDDIEALQERLARGEQGKDEAEALLLEIQKELNVLDDAREEFDNSVGKDDTNDFKRVNQLVQTLKKKLDDNEGYIQNLESEIKGEKDRNIESIERNKALHEEILLLHNKILEAEKKILLNQNRHDEITEDLREKMKYLNMQLNDEKRTVFEKQMEADELRVKINDLETREELNQQTIEMLKERHKLLEDDVESLRERLLEGEKGRDEAEAILFEIRKELSVLEDAKEKGTSDTEDFQRVNQLVHILKKKLEDNDVYIEILESEVQAEKSQKNESIERNKALDDEISLLRDKIVEAKETILRNQAIHDETAKDLRERMTDLTKQLNEEKRIVFEKGVEVEEIKGKVNFLETREELGQQKIEILEEENNLLRADIESFQRQLSEAQKEKEEVESLLIEMQRELSELEDTEEKGSNIAGNGDSNDYKRLNQLVQTLKKKLEDNQTFIENLRGEIQAEKDLNSEGAQRNTTLVDEISLLRDKVVESEATILKNQATHDEITDDLKVRVEDLNKLLSDEKYVNFEKGVEADELKAKVTDLKGREELSERKIEILQERNKLLQEDIESLQEQLLEGERGKDEAEALLFEIQKELDVLDDDKEGEEIIGGVTKHFARVRLLVQTLKKKLEDNQGYIQNLESEIKGEKDRNTENIDEIERLLRRIESEEKGKEEQGQLIETIRNLLDENEKLAADLESQNKALNEDIAEERDRVMELRGRVGELQQTINDEKRVNVDMEMEVSKLKNQLEDEESKNELSLKRIELLQQEINNLLQTIKEKVGTLEELRSQVCDYEDLKDKLKAERQRNEDNVQSVMELQNRVVRNEKILEEKEEEIRKITVELKITQEKLENAEKELEWIKENNKLLSGILQEKDRSLLEKEERLKQALANLNSERTVQNEYSVKCEMLEKKIYLTESENKEVTKVAELAENELKKEKERNAEKGEELNKLKELIEEERQKNQDSQRFIHDLEEQLSDADALNQYNQGIKSNSIENLMEAEKQNEQLLNIIEEMKENVNEKELGIEELVTRYAVEEQKLRDEVTHLKHQLDFSRMDNQTKTDIIKYLKDEVDRMNNVMRIKESVFGVERRGSNVNENVSQRVQELEQCPDASILPEYEDRLGEEPGEELDEQESDVQEFLEILEGEKRKNIVYEDMIQRLEEMVRLKDVLSNTDECDSGNTERANETRKELYFKTEEYKDKKHGYMHEEVIRLGEIIDDLRGRLRAEQRQVKDRDHLISRLNEANKRDLARNEDLSGQLHAVKERAMQQLRHSEEMTKKVEDGQKLIRDLEVQVEKEKLRASTIESVLATEKGKSTEKKEVTKDLKRRVEEYQKTVNDIKGKVDKINRHLHCMSPGGHDSPRVGAPDASMKRINERLASHSSFIRELKASVSAVEETSKTIREELRTHTDKNTKQDRKIEELLGRSSEYDNLVVEMKQELGEIRKSYQELSGDLAPVKDIHASDGRPESPTKLLRSLPEHELMKQMSNFEELLEALFSEEARRIEELQDKLDEVFQKNIEFSSILLEIKANFEDDRSKRVPWEVERDELKTTVSKSEAKIDHLVSTLEKEEMKKEKLREKIQGMEDEVKDKEKLSHTLQTEIREAEKIIKKLEKELKEEQKLNSDLQETMIKELDENLQDSKNKLEEIKMQADQELQKTVALSMEENSKKEEQIRELENEMEKQGHLLEELRSCLEKEQNSVFELNERLEIERSNSAMKENMIADLREKLKSEIERSKELSKVIMEAEDRTLRLSEALTTEQVRGVEREDAMKHLRETLKVEEGRLSDATDALEEEMQRTKHLKEKLSFEQLLKSEFERELDKTKTSLAEERKAKDAVLGELNRDKSSLYETGNKLKEQEDTAKQMNNIMDELKSELDTERKCYQILTARLQSEQNRIVELEIKLNKAETVINSDKSLLDNLRENCLQVEEKQCEVLEKLEKAEKLIREKDEEINTLINELAAEKIRVEELLADLESERLFKSQMEERIKELEETTTRDELLFEELRRKIDAEAIKNREIAEHCDQERMKGQMLQKRVRELEKHVAQDSETFDELKRNIEAEKEQSRKLDEMLQKERNETVRRDNILTDLEGQLHMERIARDEVTGQLEYERKCNSDLHDQLRLSREEEFNRKEIERKLTEEMKYEMQEKIAIQAKKAEELESMLESEQFKVFEKEISRSELQNTLEQKDRLLAQVADELAKDLEDGQSSTDDEKESRDRNVVDGLGRTRGDFQEKKNQYDDLFDAILARRTIEKNGKQKSRERKRRLVEKESLLEDLNRKYEEERKQKVERVLELQEYEERITLFHNEREEYREKSERLQYDLESERNRSHDFETLLADEQKKNHDLAELVRSLENKVNEGFSRMHATTEQYEERMRENRARQEENIKLRDLCGVQQDKIEQLHKELEGIRILCQEKENFAQDAICQVKDLKKEFDEAERDICVKEVEEKRKRGSQHDNDEPIETAKESREALSSLRDEINNVKRIMNNKLRELTDLRKQLSETGDVTDSASFRKMQERALKAETQLKKLQSSYQLLQADIEIKKFLVEEAHVEAKSLRNALNEKVRIIIELSSSKESDKASKTKEEYRDENEIHKLKLNLSMKEKEIENLSKEYKAQLAKKDSELRDLEMSIQVVKSVYQGLTVEKEREDALKNAEKMRKSKEDIGTAVEMVADLKEQIDTLQGEIAEQQQIAQSLKEDDKSAKLRGENEKNYLKRRTSIRGVISTQIDEKEKKLKRLQTLLVSIENRYGRDILRLRERDENGESTNSEEVNLSTTLPLPDLVGNAVQCAVKENDESTIEYAHPDQNNQSGVDENVLLNEKSRKPLVKWKTFFVFVFAAIALGVFGVVFGSKASRLWLGVIAASVISIFVFVNRLRKNVTEKGFRGVRYREKELLDKIEEMSILREGDEKLIGELKRQLQDEIADKEVKRVEMEQLLATNDAISSYDNQRDAEEFEARMRQEIEKTKLYEAEKSKRGFEEYKVLQEKIDYMRQLRESDMMERQAKIAELEKLAVISDERREYGIKAFNIPISVIPICLAISFLLCKLSVLHFAAPYVMFGIAVTFSTNAWLSRKKVAQMLRYERQNFEEQNEEMDEMTDLLDRQFDVVKSQKSAIDMLMKEIEKEKQERKEKRNTLAKLIWQLQELEGMQHIISKQSPKRKETKELEDAVRSKAEEKALERAKFYNSMINTLKEINADEEENGEMAADLQNSVQELADLAEDQLEEKKNLEWAQEKRERPKKKTDISWRTVTFVAINVGVLSVCVALQSYLVAALTAFQALVYCLGKREESLDQVIVKLRRETIRNQLLQSENQKLKKLLDTEKTYKMSDELALEIKKKQKTRQSRKSSCK
ncbi:golgin subfamily A member 4-like [Montipora capricornis]|uniref:golgin subfamily A member 4-like n=1 Tax=Montipora capricornis TaxID=246305 RepID=UPI0035F203D2